MTEPLKFLADVPAMTGGKDAILARAAKEFYFKGAPDDSKQVRKFAVATIVEAIKDQLRAPLLACFEAHIQAVEDEHVLMEGAPPLDDGDEANAWNVGLATAMYASFAGDLVSVLGGKTIDKWIKSDDSTADLVELVLKNAVSDPGNAFSKLGITPDNIESFLPSSPLANAPPSSDFSALLNIGATESSRQRKRSPSISEPTALTKAAQGALIALHEHSRLKDEEVAKALGVSRASVIGYREGKTLFSPNEAQTGALTGLLDRASAPLRASSLAFIELGME